jgi:hypothetical protein
VRTSERRSGVDAGQKRRPSKAFSSFSPQVVTLRAPFNILECADLDEALEVASTNPGSSFGSLELRPIES